MNPREEFEGLLAATLDDRPDASRNERLCTILRLHPEWQDDYVDQMQMHALLIWREGRVAPTNATVEPALETNKIIEPAETPLRPESSTARRNRRRSRWALATALTACAIAACFLLVLFSAPSREAEAGPEVVDQLVGWNLEIAQAQSHDERQKIFESRAESMKELLTTSHISPEDRDLGQALMDNSEWMANNDDPTAEAERFAGIADKLLTRMDSASGTDDHKRIVKYAESYSRLTEFGVALNLDRAFAAKAHHDPKRKHKIDRVIADDANRAKRLDDMLDRHADASAKAIHKARKAHTRKTNFGSK